MSLIDIISDENQAVTKISKICNRLSLEEGCEIKFNTFGEPQSISEIVKKIIADVKTDGDSAVSHFLSEIDKVKIDADKLIVSDAEYSEARESISSELESALQLMAKRIRIYAEQMMPQKEKWFEAEKGHQLGFRFTPIENIGAYVPGGLGGSTPLISTVLMNLIPAKVAGVRNIVVATPPGPGGKLHPALIRACEISGATTVYKAGGAQGVAAMAYGTASCPTCSKIIGPGNAFVQEAKKQLFGLIDIDMMAGPSEIAILADHTAKAPVLAADMIAQAEHDKLAASVIISTNKELLKNVQKELTLALKELPKKEIAEESLKTYGSLLLCKDLDQGCEWMNQLAPEHLEIICENARDVAAQIEHAGAIFIGPWTPEVVGDYTAGPSHTLPTCGAARFSSGINVYSFLKSSSLLEYSEEAMKEDLTVLTTMARTENLEGHARSAESRF